MIYALKWHPQAFKVLERLPKETIQRVLNKFDTAEKRAQFISEKYGLNAMDWPDSSSLEVHFGQLQIEFVHFKNGDM